MTTLVQPVTTEGLLIPRAVLEQCGVLEGHQMVIQLERHGLRIVPAEWDPEEITDRAATYVFEHVGDATAVGQPQRVGDRWRVPVILPHRQRTLGHLVLSRSGEIVHEESDTPRAMRERANEG